jgi:hypothetical protein
MPRPQQSRRGAHDGVIGVAAGGERVGYVGLGDGDPWLGHVSQRAQAVDDPVQLGSLLGRDLLRVHGEHGDLVAEEVLAEEQPEGDDEDEHEALQDDEEHPDQDGIEHDHEEAGHEHAGGQAPIGLDVVRKSHQLCVPPFPFPP